MAKDFVRVIENVEVVNFTSFTCLCTIFYKGPFECLRRTDVPGARGRGKEENSFEHSGYGLAGAGAGAAAAGCVRLYSAMKSLVTSRLEAA